MGKMATRRQSLKLKPPKAVFKLVLRQWSVLQTIPIDRFLVSTNSDDSERGIVAFNAVELTATGQIVIPYGEQPVNSLDTRTGARRQVVQRLDRAAAERIAANFASLLQRAKRLVFGEVPVYVGHPDVFPKDFPDNRAYGWVKSINATDEGLVIDVDWNSLGRQLVQDRTYRWPSPAWDLEETSEKSSNGLPIVIPIRLFSIGMTNQPNWKTVAAVNAGDRALAMDTAAAPANQRKKEIACQSCSATFDYAAQPETSPGTVACPSCGARVNQNGKPVAAVNAEDETTNQRKKEIAMDKRLEFLLGWLGLNADATEEQIKAATDAKLAAVNEAVAAKERAVKDLANERTAWAAKKAEFEGAIAELNGRLTAANEATAAARAARADYALRMAVADGRITPAEKDGLKAKLVACNDDSAYLELDKLPKKVKTEPVAANAAGRKAEAAASESGVQAIIVAVNAEMARSGADWDTAYQAVKRAQPALFTKQNQ